MENGNKPINPILNWNEVKANSIGLTKREYFAAMAMQGYISTGKASNAIDWVRCADELLKALETKSE